MKNPFNGSVAIGNHLYGFDTATLKCIEASTGKTLWAKRGLGKGSLIVANGMLIILGETGELVLAEATHEAYRTTTTTTHCGQPRAADTRSCGPAARSTVTPAGCHARASAGGRDGSDRPSRLSPVPSSRPYLELDPASSR